MAASDEASELDATLVQEWHAVVAAIQMSRYQATIEHANVRTSTLVVDRRRREVGIACVNSGAT